MDEDHVYIDENGVTWSRKWTLPNAQIDADIDPFDKTAFLQKTSSEKGTLGDLWDRSREMSERRKQKNGGKDPVKEAYKKQWSKERKGRTPPPTID